MDFWNEYLALCNKIGKAPETVAAELGIADTICNKWRNGTPPSSTSVCKIAKYFDVTPECLLGRTEPIAIKATKAEWAAIMDRMSDENRQKLQEHAELLLQLQGQDVQEDL